MKILISFENNNKWSFLGDETKDVLYDVNRLFVVIISL